MKSARLLIALVFVCALPLAACGSTSTSSQVKKVDSRQLKASARVCTHPKSQTESAAKCSSDTTPMSVALAVPAGWQPYRFSDDSNGPRHMLGAQVKDNCRLLVAININPKGSPTPITAQGIKRSTEHGLVAGGGNWALTLMGSGWLELQAGPLQKSKAGNWYPVWNLSTYAIQSPGGQMDPQAPDCATDQSEWAKQATQQLFKQVKLTSP